MEVSVVTVAPPVVRSSVEFYFAELAGGDVVDKAADGDTFWNPRMGAELLQLVTHIFIDVLEGVEEGGRDGGGSRAILDSGAQVLFAGVHQAAVGVIDDHDFFRAKEMMGNDEGAKRVFRDDAAGVADDVGVAGLEAESANGKARVHTGEYGEFALGARSEFAQLVGARINFVGGEYFVDDSHGGNSLSGVEKVSSGQ